MLMLLVFGEEGLCSYLAVYGWSGTHTHFISHILSANFVQSLLLSILLGAIQPQMSINLRCAVQNVLEM